MKRLGTDKIVPYAGFYRSVANSDAPRKFKLYFLCKIIYSLKFKFTKLLDTVCIFGIL